MSLFNNVGLSRQRSKTTLNPAEAFAAITLVAVASDGYIADEEIQAISTALHRMQMFRSYPDDVMRRMFERLMRMLSQQGVNNLLYIAVESLPFELKETAFAMAVDIVFADGEVAEEEEKLLNQLYSVLGISQDIATKILDVMIIKNKG